MYFSVQKHGYLKKLLTLNECQRLSKKPTYNSTIFVQNINLLVWLGKQLVGIFS